MQSPITPLFNHTTFDIPSVKALSADKYFAYNESRRILQRWSTARHIAKQDRVVKRAMAQQPASDIDVAEIWVNVTEAAQITGYSRDRVQRIAYNNWNLPEEEREITVVRHSNGYMIWLPSLVEYFTKPTFSRGSRGPRTKRKHPNT